VPFHAYSLTKRSFTIHISTGITIKTGGLHKKTGRQCQRLPECLPVDIKVQSMKNYQTGYLSIKNRYHVLKNKAALLFGFENGKLTPFSLQF
jgi:hypothetical protein